MIPITGSGRAPRQPRRRSRLLAFAAVLALVMSACSSTTPTPSPAGSGSPASGSPAATMTPLGSGQPGPTGAPGPGESPAAAALPLPTMTEPGAIGEALYDPTRMDVAVVSLLQLMGVGIYARDGTPIRKGAEHAAGDPWLFAGEVRGLIDMGIEDLLAADDDGVTPYKFSDLYTALAPAFEPQISLAQFTAAYGDAYAAHPNDLVPQVLLGQPIEPAMSLTRVQLWLMLMDGFVGPAKATTGYMPPGSRMAQAPAGLPFGTAQAGLPSIFTGLGLDAEDLRELTAHLPTLPDTISFKTLQPQQPHEGHGGPGTAVTATAYVLHERSLVSPVTGHVLLEARTGSLAGLPITWRSRNVGILRAHGSLSAQLPATMVTDAAGDVDITYTPKKEVANGQGVVANDFASLYAVADRLQIVERVYVLRGLVVNVLASNLLGGGRIAEGQGFTIEWHTPGIELRIDNQLDVTVGVSVAGAVAHRTGNDIFEGALTPREDGTWRGTLKGTIGGPTEFSFRTDKGSLVLPLVAADCEVHYRGEQSLFVVGRQTPSGQIATAVDVLRSGSFGTQDLVLSFYPASPPSGTKGTCVGQEYEPYLGPPYVGPGPDGSPMFGTYAAWNDLRFTSPIGYTIHLPPSDSTDRLEYVDNHQNFPPAVVSQFTVTVTRTAP